MHSQKNKHFKQMPPTTHICVYFPVNLITQNVLFLITMAILFSQELPEKTAIMAFHFPDKQDHYIWVSDW